MRIVICDDDPVCTDQLKKYIGDYFKRYNLKCPTIVTYHSGDELLKDTGEKDILFLDIEMPGVNGIHTGNILKKKNPNIIIFIITSYTEYLDEAMRFHVFRYLSKPIDKQRLYRNLQDALQLYHSANTKVAIKTKQDIYAVLTADIICVEAQNRLVTVHTINRDYASIQNMEFWINVLPKNCFFQTHRSFIVNFAHVCDFNNTTIHLYDRQLAAYLTRRRYKEFKEAYLLFLESMR